MTTPLIDSKTTRERCWSKVFGDSEGIVTVVHQKKPTDSTIVTDIIAVGVDVIASSEIDVAGDGTSIEKKIWSVTHNGKSCYGTSISQRVGLEGGFARRNSAQCISEGDSSCDRDS